MTHRTSGRTPRFLIAGEGGLRSEFEGLAHELGFEYGADFLGIRRDVREFMNRVNIFTMPSLHGGLPMAVLEAMAVGEPMVDSALGGIPEALRDPQGSPVTAREPGPVGNGCLAPLCTTGQVAGIPYLHVGGGDSRLAAGRMGKDPLTPYSSVVDPGGSECGP